MAGDADGLFAKAMAGKRAIDEEDSDKRKLLRRYDHLAVQALNPFGVSDLDKATLSQLWEVIKNGNKTTSYFAEWADSTAYRKGIAVSRLAEVLEKTIEVLKDPKFKELLNKTIMEEALKEATILSAHLANLNGGKSSQTERKVTMSTLGKKDGPTKPQSAVEISAKYLYDWLAQETSTLRGLISFLSQGGVFFAAHCAEKGARSYVKCGGEKQEDFVAAAVARLCKKETQEEEAPDDSSILFKKKGERLSIYDHTPKWMNEKH